MQGHLHPHYIHQQQLAALLSVALPKPSTAASTAAAATGEAVAPVDASSTDESRLSALDSLHRAILYPPNSLLLSHSAAFLSQCFTQLLIDKSYAVRSASATAYGSLCGIIGAVPLPSSGQPNGLFHLFIAWALPLLSNVSTGDASALQLALEGLREFLAVGDAGKIERYVPSVLKACQELLEDERTSTGFLPLLLDVLTLISFKFGECFRPHFVDIVDVLLGWVFMPDLPDPDRHAIMDSFLKLRSHWLDELPFSMGLLSKFLGDMEVLIQDGVLGRLLSLFSCFSTVLKALSSGAIELNVVEQISEPIEGISPSLLQVILLLGNKFGWSVWMEEIWKSLILLAEILQEKLSAYYPMVLNILFQSMHELSYLKLIGILKSNMKLISLQKQKLSLSSVTTLLHYDSPFSKLRLYPNHQVIGVVASVYLLFVQHDSVDVVSKAISSIFEELKFLRRILGETRLRKDHSEMEVVSLIIFDLQILLTCHIGAFGSPSSRGSAGCFTDHAAYERSAVLSSFIFEQFFPFEYPIEDLLELQVHILRALHKLSKAELLTKHALLKTSSRSVSDDLHDNVCKSSEGEKGHLFLVAEYSRKYTACLIKSLQVSSPLMVKMEALNWVSSFCSVSLAMDNGHSGSCNHSFLEYSIDNGLVMLVLKVANDKEASVRAETASVLQNLLQAGLFYPGDLHAVAGVAVDKLGDPSSSVKKAFLKLLSVVLPMTVYFFGLSDYRTCLPKLENAETCRKTHYPNWKHALALKQYSQKLVLRQLVSVLSYISQKWKVPLSSWIHRLVSSSSGKSADMSSAQQDQVSDNTGDFLLWDVGVDQNLLDMVFLVNDLAAAWWSIHEAARQCVMLRLRTNLGGPTQTFAALERMLLDIPSILLLDTEQGEGAFSIGSSNFHLLPMRLLLDFIEALKKHIYNAYEGSVGLPSPTLQSSLFFRANKKVCEEWFSRMCEPMMNAGLALHCNDAVFHYCALRLQDLRNRASSLPDQARGAHASENLQNVRARVLGDMLRILQHAALALCRSHEPDALDGLQRWATLSFSDLIFQETRSISGNNEAAQQFSWMTGLIYQSQGQYEKAAAFFSHLLQSENSLSFLGSDGIQFVITRTIECYSSLSDWKSLDTWLVELQNLRTVHAGRAHSGALTAAGNDINAVHALARYDEGDMKASWGYLDLTPKSSDKLTLDPKIALEKSELMLLKSMLLKSRGEDNVPELLEKAKLMLEEVISVTTLDGLPESASCAFQLHCIFAFEDNYNLIIHDEEKQLTPLSHSIYRMFRTPINTINQDYSLWTKVFRVYCSVLPNSFVTLLLSQRLHSLARKQKNYLLADRLSNFFGNHSLINSGLKEVESLIRNLRYDNILLKFAEGEHEEALMSLWSFARTNLEPGFVFASDADSFIMAKAWLKLSKWLKKDNLNINISRILVTLVEDFSKFFEFSVPGLQSSSSSLRKGQISEARANVIIEELVGTAMKLSCRLCPTMGKAWLSYASWCFSQARGSPLSSGVVLETCSLSPILDQELTKDRFQLTEEEMSRIRDIVRKICINSISAAANNQINEAYFDSLVRQVAYILHEAAGGIADETTDASCPSVTLSFHLLRLFQGMSIIKGAESSSSIDELIEVWWLLRQRRVSLFGHAAHGYFQYLSNSCFTANENPNVMEGQARCSTLRAMLYILHILLNYGSELTEILDHGLATVPLLTWQEITPQLFARLSSHPRQTTRKHLEVLLLMLAKQSPWSIVYPALVDKDACDGEPSEELQCLLNYLGKLYPKLIQDVQLVINELRSITVLWEEQWLATLQELRADVMRRINMLKDEASRISGNTTLSFSEKNKINAAKYTALMAPVIVTLERRLASTSREPETAHETWFHKEYRNQLESAILAFKTPPRSSDDQGDIWHAFDAIEASLATCQRNLSISLSDVAPRLTSLSSSDVPVPGLEKQRSTPNFSSCCFTGAHGIVTISSFSDKLMILSTKTKPKKLLLLGSDGQNYTYLLKGREDLRLDARIMQLLQAINCLLHSYSDPRRRSLSIRHYSVTPISGRAGLIQWVDGVMSIYSIFKSWQNRNRLAQVSSVGAGGNSPSLVPPIPNPSDMFFGKIIPALKEKGIRRVISRRDWPLEVKRKVFLELMQETPRELLWNELWCSSEGFKAFDSKSKRFSGSVATMSMVGYILGLGDRHLDNILIDLYSGDVVHIDYNVCFDKGQRLKIPEIVPFRLTQIIEAALGLTGREGAFRFYCETVISVLQKNKDIILMLLDVFAWDPLVEWTRGDVHDEVTIGGEEKKGMELAVSLSLFSSRFQEIRVAVQEHHDLLLATLPAAESALKSFLMLLEKFEVSFAAFRHADKERSSLLQHEMSAKSHVTEATSLSEKARSFFEFQAHEFQQEKALAIEKAQEATLWVDLHGRILDALRSGSIPDSQFALDSSRLELTLSLTSAVLVSGVPLNIVPEPTLAQCSDLDGEVAHLISEMVSMFNSAREVLLEYAMVLQRVMPLNYFTMSPLSRWAQLLQLSVNNLSADVLAFTRAEAAELVAKAQGNGFDSIQMKHHDLLCQIESQIVEINKITNDCSELMNSVGSDTENKSKNHLLSSFAKYMNSAACSRNNDDNSGAYVLVGENKNYGIQNFKDNDDLGDRKKKVLSVLINAVTKLYDDVKGKVLHIIGNIPLSGGWNAEDDGSQLDSVSYRDFEEQIQKCILVEDFINEVRELVAFGIPEIDLNENTTKVNADKNWASAFETCWCAAKHLIEQITEVILREVVGSLVSYKADVMEAFGFLCQIRGSIDTGLEQLIEVEIEKLSLLELERNYFMKVRQITEQQVALEEASTRSRDHLSWEEAEELASQEEVCRDKLDQLHQSWNEKDVRRYSLAKLEASVKNSVSSSQRYFVSLVANEQESDLHIRRSNILIAALDKPFMELEAYDRVLAASSPPPYVNAHVNVVGLLASGTSPCELMWRFSGFWDSYSFFIWKVCVIDSVLDLCIHNVSSAIDENLGFVQICELIKKKLDTHLQIHFVNYMKERLSPAFLMQLDKQHEKLQQIIGAEKDMDATIRDSSTVRSVQFMLEEYCNAHETARAARSAVSLMKKQVNELVENVRDKVQEVVQMEWMHDLSFPPLMKTKVLSQNILGEDKLLPAIMNICRPKLLERMQSSASSLSRLVEGLQASERTSLAAEGRLVSAMEWACSAPSFATTSSSSSKIVGIPSEFHEHISKRKNFLRTAKEQVSSVVKICTSVIEFESSRDGVLHNTEKTFGRSSDGRSWQQIYLNCLARLDVIYHSFIRAEQEQKLSQSNMETAVGDLYSVAADLSLATTRARSASVDLQNMLVALYDSAHDASAALSSFGTVFRGHTALTSECGSMLEEVLAITESLHDLHNLGKKASATHSSLMENLSKVSMILLPLETSFSTDVAAMADALSRETKNKAEISPIHGQALHKSYCSRLRDTIQSLEFLVPSITYSAKILQSILIKLSKDCSLHAGNLHKALEGVGESQILRSQELALSRLDISDNMELFDKEEVLLEENIEDTDRFLLGDEDRISPKFDHTSGVDYIASPTKSSNSETAGLEGQILHNKNNENNECSHSPSVMKPDKLESESAFLVDGDSSAIFDELDIKEGVNVLAISYEPVGVTGEPSFATKSDKSPTNLEDNLLDDANSAPYQDRENVLSNSNLVEGEIRNCVDFAKRSSKGKNALAMSVLRQVELKLEGKENEDIRFLEIADQVDYLLNQATSIDNLCNMYEVDLRHERNGEEGASYLENVRGYEGGEATHIPTSGLLCLKKYLTFMCPEKYPFRPKNTKCVEGKPWVTQLLQEAALVLDAWSVLR